MAKPVRVELRDLRVPRDLQERPGRKGLKDRMAMWGQVGPSPRSRVQWACEAQKGPKAPLDHKAKLGTRG